MPNRRHLALLRALSGASLRLIVLLGFGLTLGACSKCDFPTPWERSTPASCHDSPSPQ